MSWNYTRYMPPSREERAKLLVSPRISEDRAWWIDYEQGRARMRGGAPYVVTLIRYLGYTEGTWELWNRLEHRVGVYKNFEDLAYHAVRYGYADFIENLWAARWYALSEDGGSYSTMYAAAAALDMAVYKANNPRHKSLPCGEHK